MPPSWQSKQRKVVDLTSGQINNMNTKLLTGSGLVVAIALFLGVNIIANQTLTNLRLDVTEGRLHTLSQGTQNILAEIDEPITIRFYFSAKRFTGIPEFATYGKRVR
ncbi:MAG: hypothetical protein E2O36_02955, partial [Proteobacteria bacterium]